MTRTNIDINDELIDGVMRQWGLKSKREAVDVALRRMYREPLSLDEALAMQGTGWGDGGLELEDVRPAFKPWRDE